MALSFVTTRSVFIGVAAVVALVFLATSVAVLPTGTGGPTTSGPGSTSAMSVDSLKLSLQISTEKDNLGGSVVINVSEANTHTSPLNISAANKWGVGGLRMSACYASVYPFGVAVYQGRYTHQNVSSAVPLNLYPLTPCPLLLRYISGYYFQPSSDMALVLPGTGPYVTMASGVAASGSYTSANSLTSFAPGTYTVVAGDEWGTLAFLYFTVS